jgi:FtsH-binding integral membrane protein
MAGFVLAIAMVVMVVLTAAGLAVRVKGTPSMELVLGLLAVTFTDAFDFAVLAGFAYALRRDAAAHKRLIIIATACLTRAAFFRWHVPILFRQVYPAYAATYVFLLLLAEYDLWSTRKIHRATMWGSLFLIVMGSSPALSDHQRLGMRLHTGCKVGEYDGELPISNVTPKSDDYYFVTAELATIHPEPCQ